MITTGFITVIFEALTTFLVIAEHS